MVRLGLFQALGAGTAPEDFQFETPLRMVGTTLHYRSSVTFRMKRAFPDTIELYRMIPFESDEDPVYTEDLRIWWDKEIPDEKFRVP